jgi:hypothetical protein
VAVTLETMTEGGSVRLVDCLEAVIGCEALQFVLVNVKCYVRFCHWTDLPAREL